MRFGETDFGLMPAQLAPAASINRGGSRLKKDQGRPTLDKYKDGFTSALCLQTASGQSCSWSQQRDFLAKKGVKDPSVDPAFERQCQGRIGESHTERGHTPGAPKENTGPTDWES